MSSVKVIDLNNEEAKDETPVPQPIEEAKEEQTPEPEIINEVVEENNHNEEIAKSREALPSVKEEVIEEKPKPKRQTQKDRIQCPKCLKDVSLKTYRYSHEKNCQGQLADKPVKPHTKPKTKQPPKPKPKPPPEIYYSDDNDEEDARQSLASIRDDVVQQPLIKNKQKQPKQPINPVTSLAEQYALLHQQLMQQKQVKYDKVCNGMFAPRVKKR